MTSIQDGQVIEGPKYGKFEEDIESSKTYGTMGGNEIGHVDPYQPNPGGVDNPGFQESSFTEYPDQQVNTTVLFTRYTTPVSSRVIH